MAATDDAKKVLELQDEIKKLTEELEAVKAAKADAEEAARVATEELEAVKAAAAQAATPAGTVTVNHAGEVVL